MGEYKEGVVPVAPGIVLDHREIKMDFIRSCGPGGQNVNKVATAVQLRFDVPHSESLPEDVRRRLVWLAGNRMTSNGILIIQARRFRSQEKNREDAIHRLVGLIRQAAGKPKPRKKTIPNPLAKKRRLEEKRKRSEIKKQRRINTD